MCEARQYSDQMLCDRCGLQWDVNDPDPPECGPLTVTVKKSAAVGWATTSLDGITTPQKEQNGPKSGRQILESLGW